MRRLRPPSWLRRAIEGALVGGGVAVVSLLGTGLGAGGTGAPPVALPSGPALPVLLAPAVLGIGVVAPTYPIALAATRGDAVLGAIAGFLLAADACLILTAGPVSLERAGVVLAAGALVSLLALPAALVGAVVGQAVAPLGFGRRAGAFTAAGAVISGAVVLCLLALVG
jgi:hypothetical protein